MAAALHCHQRGQLEDAERLYRLALVDHNDHAEALHLLGVLTHQRGQPASAIHLIARAIVSDSGVALFYNSLGNALRARGRFAEAIDAYSRALLIAPHFADARNNLGLALKALDRVQDAILAFRQALAARPDLAEAHNNLGNALRTVRQLSEAERAFKTALALVPDFAETCSNLGMTALDQYRIAPADFLTLRAVAIGPGQAEFRHNRAIVQIETGDLTAARRSVETAIALAPRCGRYYRVLANLGGITPQTEAFHSLQAMLAEPQNLPILEQIEAHFALGKVFADNNQPEPSFRHLTHGNRLMRQRISYDEADTLARFNRIRAVFTRGRLRAGAGLGFPSPLPVFVVGMPRSGTSLVEQILASHPDIFGAGELIDLPALADQLDPQRNAAGYPDILLTLPPERLRALGSDYSDALARQSTAGAKRVIDKLPGNFQHLGLITLALPNARIIHIQRDPLDTCLSCYSKLFETGALPFSYDLAELGRYYRAYAELMAHWRRVLPPGVMLEISYESLVADLEGQARAMLHHCGIDWDPRCLDFHRTRRTVRTASAVQVRSPITDRSVGRWRVYGPALAPLQIALGDLLNSANW